MNEEMLVCGAVLVVVLFFAGCDLFSQSSGPVMTFVNGSETETIEELEVRAYLRVESRTSPPLNNALGDSVTLASGEEVTITLPAELSNDADLKVSVRIAGVNYSVYLFYDDDFTLTFNGSAELDQFSVTAGDAEIQL